MRFLYIIVTATPYLTILLHDNIWQLMYNIMCLCTSIRYTSDILDLDHQESRPRPTLQNNLRDEAYLFVLVFIYLLELKTYAQWHKYKLKNTHHRIRFFFSHSGLHWIMNINYHENTKRTITVGMKAEIKATAMLHQTLAPKRIEFHTLFRLQLL